MICFGKDKIKEKDRKQWTEHHKWDNNKEALKAFLFFLRAVQWVPKPCNQVPIQ